MNIEQSTEILWQSVQKRVHFPEELKGKLTLQEAYRVQQGMLARWLAKGEKQVGWKIGLTADAVRKLFNSPVPAFGYLLTSRHFSSGHAFRFEDLINPALESELCFTVKKDIRGPGTTEEQVLSAIDSVAPAFEIVERRGDMAGDFPLAIADDVAQWGFVTGTEIKPYPQNLNLGQVTAEVMANRNLQVKAVGAEVIDNQIQSLIWLADQLAEYGAYIRAGQCIMTGSFTKPLPISKGDRWETRFSLVGTISASFV